MSGSRRKNPNKLSIGTLLLWSSSGISQAVQMMVLGFLTIYCTNALGMNAALVGTILMTTKIVDGIVDLFYGYIIDRTNTKLGRGRPYELMIIGLWLTTWLLFAVPPQSSTGVKVVWIIVCYTLCQSVFKSFLSISGTPYMVRAFNNDQKYVKLNSWGGLLTTLVIMAFNVTFPMFYAPIVNNAAGWTRLIAFISVPAAIIGLLRFLFVPERYKVETTNEKIHLRDVIKVLKVNHNIYPVALMVLVTTMLGNMSVISYYFLYIVKDLAISGVMSLFGIFATATLIFYPLILKKLTIKQFAQISMLVSIPYAVVAFFAGSNLVALGAATIILGIATLAPSYLQSLLIIECADYNEYRDQPRMEGTLTAIVSFFNNCGSAFGSFVLGILLSASGFDGTVETQPSSALLMIRICYAIVPMVFLVLSAIVMQFYKIDKLKPEISAALAAKQAALNNEGSSKEEAPTDIVEPTQADTQPTPAEPLPSVPTDAVPSARDASVN